MDPISFKRHRFPGAVIVQPVAARLQTRPTALRPRLPRAEDRAAEPRGRSAPRRRQLRRPAAPTEAQDQLRSLRTSIVTAGPQGGRSFPL